MRGLFRLSVVFGTVACATPVAALTAQERPQSGPILEARAQTFRRSGGLSGASAVSDWVIAGQGMKWFLSAGTNPGDMALCGSSAGDTGDVIRRLSRSPFVWELKVTPLKYEDGSTTFDLEWGRYQAADGTGRPALEGNVTLTLREGERKVLDLVHGSAGSGNCDNDTALVDVGAGYKESPQLADTVLEYEMWLTHRRSNNDAIVRKFVGTGRQGAEVAFSFVPLRSTIDVSTPDRAIYDVFTTVQGTIRGRLRPDGRIAITLDTSRRDGVGSQTGGSSGFSGNSGRKLLNVAPEETIEIELPVPRGQSATGARGAAPAVRSATPATSQRGVTIANGRVVVDNALFFNGQRTSIIVKVKPVRQ